MSFSVEHDGSWNKGRILGQKRPLKLQEIWSIRVRLELAKAMRALALFDLAIDSKLRGCDLVKLQVNYVMHGNTMLTRTMVVQQKTKQPVRFEITQRTRDALKAGLQKQTFAVRTLYSRAGYTLHNISLHASMREL